MRFTVYDFSDYFECLYLCTDDYEHELNVDVVGCYDEELEDWDTEKVKALAEKEVFEKYGPMAYIAW